MKGKRHTISLVYNEEVLQCRTFHHKEERDKVINSWTKMYALEKTKKYPVFIQITANSKSNSKFVRLITKKAA